MLIPADTELLVKGMSDVVPRKLGRARLKRLSGRTSDSTTDNIINRRCLLKSVPFLNNILNAMYDMARHIPAANIY